MTPSLTERLLRSAVDLRSPVHHTGSAFMLCGKARRGGDWPTVPVPTPCCPTSGPLLLKRTPISADRRQGWRKIDDGVLWDHQTINEACKECGRQPTSTTSTIRQNGRYSEGPTVEPWGKVHRRRGVPPPSDRRTSRYLEGAGSV